MSQTLLGMLEDIKTDLKKIISANQEAACINDLDNLMLDLGRAVDKCSSIEDRLGQIYGEIG